MQESPTRGGNHREFALGRWGSQLLFDLAELIPCFARLLGHFEPPRRSIVRFGLGGGQFRPRGIEFALLFGNQLIDLRQRHVIRQFRNRLRWHGGKKQFGLLQLVGGRGRHLLEICDFDGPVLDGFQFRQRLLIVIADFLFDGVLDIFCIIELFEPRLNRFRGDAF